jgi:nucleotide-binding universal stress UspA family protein
MATKILVPLDGSTLAEQAVSCATMLARGLPAELILFRAVSIPSDIKEVLDLAELSSEAPITPLVTEATGYLEQVAEQIRRTGLSVNTVVYCGPAADAILDYVVQTGVQQIVMATHGYSGVSRWVHGSVAERVLQSASVPVLLVRAGEHATSASFKPLSCRRILVPLDGSAVAEQVLPTATAVAKALGAAVILFRIPAVLTSMSLAGEGYLPLDSLIQTANQDAQHYLDRVAATIKAQGVQVSTALQIGGVANAIIDYAERCQIDLIAMCTHGRTGLARWALGSVADRVLRAGRIPLLLVRAQ